MDKIEVFGIWGGNISDDFIWRPIARKISHIITLYSARNMSIYGRAITVNTMALSQLCYLVASLNVLTKYIHEIKKEVFSFIWGSKKHELMKRNTAYLAKTSGGIGVIDIIKNTKHPTNTSNKANLLF